MGEGESSAVEAPEVGRRRVIRDVLRAGGRGFRWASFLIRPFALVVGLLGLIPTAFGMGAGGGLSVHRVAAGAVGFSLVCLAWGFVAGVLVGLLVRLGAAGRVDGLLGGDWPPVPGREPGLPVAPPTGLQTALGRFPPPNGPAMLDDASANAPRSALDEQAEAVALARTVAGYRRGRHELVVPTNPIATLLPKTQAARGVGRLLDADAALRAHDGQIDAALESVRAIFGVARSIGDEPFLISGLVRTAIDNVRRNALRRALAVGEASPAALEEVQAVLAADRAEPLLLTGVRGERAILDAVLTRIRAGDLGIGDLGEGGRSGSAGPAPGTSPAAANRSPLASRTRRQGRTRPRMPPDGLRRVGGRMGGPACVR